jgi:RNase adaptor protein for sRNA GlmZ degradation
VTLLLISGRPGAGKTEFCRWLRDTYNFIHVDTDTRPQILYSLVVQTAIEAQATKEYMLGLGSDVVVDWGFIPDFLGSVRLLKLVGFDAWWFDADEATARELWRRARGGSPPMQPYLAQTERIRQAWPKLSKFYRDHIVQTVEPGPTYAAFDAIAARILHSERGL